MASEEATETVVDQLHRLLTEVKDFLEDSESRKGQKLLGKVELVLESWDDDAFFAEGDEDDEDSSDEGDPLDDEEDDEEDEGSILDEVLDDEEDDEDEDED